MNKGAICFEFLLILRIGMLAFARFCLLGRRAQHFNIWHKSKSRIQDDFPDISMHIRRTNLSDQDHDHLYIYHLSKGVRWLSVVVQDLVLFISSIIHTPIWTIRARWLIIRKHSWCSNGSVPDIFSSEKNRCTVTRCTTSSLLRARKTLVANPFWTFSMKYTCDTTCDFVLLRVKKYTYLLAGWWKWRNMRPSVRRQ